MELDLVTPEFAEKPASWQNAYERVLREGLGKDWLLNEKEHQRKEMIRIALEEKAEVRKTVEGIGQLTGRIPARMYFRWLKEDPHFWDDPKNKEKFFKDNPELRASKPITKTFGYQAK